MKILSVRTHSEEELISKLRKITMLHDDIAFPYATAAISLEHIATNYISPPQTYVLNSELKIKRELRWALLKQKNIDMFNLNGYITMTIEYNNDDFTLMGINHQKTTIELLPPIVEESIENDGRVHCLINDGMHRIYLARLEAITPQVVYIRGLPKKFPYYAFPIKNGWLGVDRVDEIPKTFVKKWHRIKNYKTLYRNFNSVFTNTSAPRGVIIKEQPNK